jgi:2-polyprenyl-6-methoxyphenol hydroxylase-like FAD-dependent oxidoreductase
MMDAMNLSFKLHFVLGGLAQPSLLKTYEEERWPIAKYLVDFDAQFAALFSGEIPKKDIHHVGKMTSEERQQFFVRVQRENAEFTSGFQKYLVRANGRPWCKVSREQTKLEVQDI